MGLFSARKTFRLGPLNVTVSASGLSFSLGGRHGRVGVNTKGRKRLTLRPARGWRFERSRR
jgi:hypothetical protein